MLRKWMKLSSIPVLALSLVMWGCENLSEQALTGPSESSEILIVNTDENGYTVAQETDPLVGTVYATIDQNGGSLNIGNHTLFVPAGAVDAPTLFTMNKLPGEIKVGLSATRLLPNDVGSAGFAVPVRLSLSYESASSVPNESALQIVWVKLDGSLEAQASSVDHGGKSVSASLGHFSDYAIAWPD